MTLAAFCLYNAFVEGITETERAYWAGFIDGEGCISIKKNKPTKARYNPQYTLRVSIGNTDSTNNRELKKLGASIITHRPRKENWKISYYAEFTAKNARAFLQEIYPFLRLKAKQAALALEFQELVSTQYKNLLYQNGTKGRGKFSDLQIADRERFYQQLKTLKQEVS